jgi:hypothetical protein
MNPMMNPWVMYLLNMIQGGGGNQPGQTALSGQSTPNIPPPPPVQPTVPPGPPQTSMMVAAPTQQSNQASAAQAPAQVPAPQAAPPNAPIPAPSPATSRWQQIAPNTWLSPTGQISFEGPQTGGGGGGTTGGGMDRNVGSPDLSGRGV